MTGTARVVVDLPPWAESVAPSGVSALGDGEKMSLALRLAQENVARSRSGPFGAAIFEVDSGRLVAAGVNSVVRLQNCLLHAEMVAIMLAQQRVGAFTLRAPGLPAHELVTSCEPCAMCLGAIVWSGVTRVLIGARREDAREIGFADGPLFEESCAYLAAAGVSIVRDVQRAEAIRVMRVVGGRGRAARA